MLGAPDIVGSLSECSVGVQFHKLVPGATVRLQTKAGALVDEWPVTRADQAFDFNPGHKIKAGMDVEAVQFRTGENGLLSAVVQVDGKPSPATLSIGTFVKPLFECGECVWLFNAFAGAKVQIFSHGTDFLGESVVRPDGTAHVDLKRALTINDVVTATQTACATMGGPITSATPIAAGGRVVPLDGATLPQTQVAPLKACATALYFEKVMIGASVIVTRTPTGGTSSTYSPRCLSATPFTLWGFAPFQAGEHVAIDTHLERCKKPVSPTVKLTVAAGLPGPPHILTSLCSDALGILLGSLELGAQVEIKVTTAGSSVTLLYGASAQQDTFSFALGQPGAPKIAGGSTITVRQNLCGGPAGWGPSASTTVIAAVAKVPKLQLPADHANGTSLSPTLTWIDTGTAPCSQATRFDLRVAKTMVMAPADIVFTPAPILGTFAFIPGGFLKPGATYWWQVRAYHGASTPSAWSNVFQFATLQREGSGPPPPGGPPPPSGEHTFYYCQHCPNISKPVTFHINAPDQATADAKAQAQLPSGCFLSSGKCDTP